MYKQVGAPLSVEVEGQEGLLHVYEGNPPGSSGQTHSVWSLGLTDGTTVAHLFAVMPKSRLEPALDALNAMARSLRVLPRRVNRDLMARFQGYWRYFDTHEEVAEIGERCYHFRPDGTFGFVQRRIARLEAIHHPPDLEELGLDVEMGKWDIVGNTLTMLHGDGTREVMDVDGVSSRTAVVDHVLWERLPAPGGKARP